MKKTIKISSKLWELINCCKIKNNKSQKHNFIPIKNENQNIIRDYYCNKCGLGLRMGNKKYVKIYY